jgi:hypothetical protein
MPAGRPLELTNEHKATIVDMLTLGDSVGKISKAIDRRPSTIFNWIDNDPELLDLYARAKQAKAQLLAEEVIEIADDENLKPEDKRIRVDARKWVAGKYYGKLFGDKITTEHTGRIETTDLSDDELARRLAELEQAKAQSER